MRFAQQPVSPPSRVPILRLNYPTDLCIKLTMPIVISEFFMMPTHCILKLPKQKV